MARTDWSHCAPKEKSMSASGVATVPEPEPMLWLAAFAMAMGLVSIGILCWVFRSGRISRFSWAVWSLASLLPAALCFSDLCTRLDAWAAGSASLLAKGLLVATVPVVCCLALWLRGKAAGSDSTPRLSWSLIALNAVAAIWASGCFYQAVTPIETELPGMALNWVPVNGKRAVTDHGQVLDLLRTEDSPPKERLSSIFGERFRDRVIEVAAPDNRCNCHGWVFAAGRFAVKGDDVDQILLDNDYYFIERPTAGDLVIYRNDRGHVLHSGVVRLAESDLVMVESKWGGHGRYLHQPLDQPYSQNVEFYHSARRGHVMAMEDDADSKLASKGVAPEKALKRPAPRAQVDAAADEIALADLPPKEAPKAVCADKLACAQGTSAKTKCGKAVTLPSQTKGAILRRAWWLHQPRLASATKPPSYGGSDWGYGMPPTPSPWFPHFPFPQK
jgi:hypothetical protein